MGDEECGLAMDGPRSGAWEVCVAFARFCGARTCFYKLSVMFFESKIVLIVDNPYVFASGDFAAVYLSAVKEVYRRGQCGVY